MPRCCAAEAAACCTGQKGILLVLSQTAVNGLSWSCRSLPHDTAWLAWWATQDAAKQCIAARMATHAGSATQSFAALEKGLQAANARPGPGIKPRCAVHVFAHPPAPPCAWRRYPRPHVQGMACMRSALWQVCMADVRAGSLAFQRGHEPLLWLRCMAQSLPCLYTGCVLEVLEQGRPTFLWCICIDGIKPTW